MISAALLALALAQGDDVAEATVNRAERLAEEASALAARDPAGALARAREAMGLTAEFVPTAFVGAGRKGEVVEDEFQAARAAYRRHRARVYEAMGRASAAGSPKAAERFLGRSFLLDPQPARGLALARARLALADSRGALHAARRAILGLVSLTPEAVAVVEQAVDAAGLPSAQAEIDRARLGSTLGDKVRLREGVVALPAGARLSTTPVVRLEDAPVNLIYVSEASCRSCSSDLQALSRLVPEGVRVMMLPEVDEQDAALRQVLSLYGHEWPVLVGRDLATRLELEPRQALLVARGGWTAASMNAPFGPELTTALQALLRTDVQETVPRAGWNRIPVDRSAPPPPPPLLEEGLAPGEDEPLPPEFEAAVTAYRAGRFAEARRAFDELENRGDGWLLPPEARINRALCLAGGGQRDAARRILLRTGDSRFEEDVDRLLELVAAPRSGK